MELWIRSQNKEYLIKAERLYINRKDNGLKIRYEIMEELITLGTYSSKERALEVLDEIQKLFKPQIMTTKLGQQHIDRFGNIRTEPNEYEMKELSCVVYEMPQE